MPNQIRQLIIGGNQILCVVPTGNCSSKRLKSVTKELQREIQSAGFDIGMTVKNPKSGGNPPIMTFILCHTKNAIETYEKLNTSMNEFGEKALKLAGTVLKVGPKKVTAQQGKQEIPVILDKQV